MTNKNKDVTVTVSSEPFQKLSTDLHRKYQSSAKFTNCNDEKRYWIIISKYLRNKSKEMTMQKYFFIIAFVSPI